MRVIKIQSATFIESRTRKFKASDVVPCGWHSSGRRKNVHVLSIRPTAIRKFYNSWALRKQRVIAAHADQFTGMNTSAALANDYFSCKHKLTCVTLHAKHLWLTVASISC